MDVCQQLEAASVAANCRNSPPGGLGAAAVEDAAFDLPSVPGRGGMVLRFDKDETYDRTVDSFSNAAMLAGPHRYGSRKARIFVQMNEGASAEIGAKTKAVVDALSGNGGTLAPNSAPTTTSAPPPSSAAAAPVLLPPLADAAPTPPNAMDVCRRLQGVGVAADCEGADGGATQVLFGVPAVMSKGKPARAMIVQLPNDKAYGVMLGGAATSPTLSKAPLFASERSRVIVFLMGDVKFPADVQAKTKAVVDAL